MNEPRKKFKIVTDKSARVILPNTLTLIGVCIGLTSINFALNQNFKLAIVAIVCAAIIDGLDGRIARLIKGTSKVGKELDSLTDIISFGVAPAFIMYFWTLNTLGKIGWLISLIYVVCVALRLARFNINTGGDPSWKDNFFEGVPSPAGGLLILIPLIYELSNFQINFEIKKIVPYLNIVVAFLLISKIPTFALKKIFIPPRFTIFILLLIGVIIVSLIFFTFETLLILILGYLLSIPISIFTFYNLTKKFKNENSQDDHEDIL